MYKIINLQLFTGNGNSSSTAKSKGAGGAGIPNNPVENINTKFTTAQINSMSRSQLETVARAVFIKQNMAKGLSASEADYRARSLMSGNTNAQLKKYIKRNG